MNSLANLYPVVNGSCRLEGHWMPGRHWLTIHASGKKPARVYEILPWGDCDGWRLIRKDNLECYHVSLEDRTCDCADHTFRDRTDGCCKHLKALLACRERNLI